MTAHPTPNWYLKIPPPLWALALMVLAYGLERSFAWAAVVYVHSLSGAVVTAAAGLGLAVWAVRTFAAAGTELEPASATNKAVVTDGPFRFTRNAMYLGLVLMTAGIALYMGTLPFLAVPALVFLLCDRVFIPYEEAKMHRQHGDPYTDYIGRVRRWI